MPHRSFLELQNAISQPVVHGARNQPGEGAGVVVEIYLPDIFGEPQDTVLILERVDHGFGCVIEICQAGEPFGVMAFRFMLFGHVDHDNGTVHKSAFQLAGLGNDPLSTAGLDTYKKLERAKGFEPSTPTLARSCSTTELHPHPSGLTAIRRRQRAELCQIRLPNATARVRPSDRVGE
jgi:hypothetical protein